ncbi:MAG: C39 family peptidase [Candidatus Roizmanbacteria bacterium]|nr:C39 family peptidase [Candidatus Roizmanbacteria bacterium]
MKKLVALTAGIVFGLIALFALYSYATSDHKISAGQPARKTAPVTSSTPTVTPGLILQTSPVQKKLSGGTQVFQTFNNCGPAALSMTLSHYGIFVSQQELGQALRPYQNPQGDNDDKSVVLDELAYFAEKNYDFIPYHRPVGNMDLVKLFITYDMPVITRTLLREGEDIGHYRVITGYDDNRKILIQDDSLQGKQLTYSYDEFNRLWEVFSYEYVVLVPHEKKEIAEAILGDYVNERYAWEQSVSLATDSLKQNPNNMYATFNRSVAYYHLGQYEKAIADFESVENQLPWRTLWYQIDPILAYYQLGNFDRVLSITDQILTNHNRAFSELYFLRGKIYEKHGNESAAQEEFRNVELYNSSFDPEVLAL